VRRVAIERGGGGGGAVEDPQIGAEAGGSAVCGGAGMEGGGEAGREDKAEGI
jgi:hypothetical protein